MVVKPLDLWAKCVPILSFLSAVYGIPAKSSTSENLMRHQVFHDFDEFAESIRDVDARMVLVNPKQYVWTSSVAELEGIDLQMGWLGNGNLAHAGLCEDFYLCYLPTTPGIEFKASGVVLKVCPLPAAKKYLASRATH